MEDEQLACIKEAHFKYLESGQLSKYIFPLSRKEAHEKGVVHLVVRIFIMTISPQKELLFLVQKRSDNKRSYPNYFTDSASGHVLYREKLSFKDIKEDALRELEEEMGILEKDVKKLNFERIEREKDQFTGEIAYIFFGLVDSDVKLEPDAEEVDVGASKFYTEKELRNILNKKQLVDHSKEIWNELLKLDIKSYFEKVNGKKRGDNEIGLFLGRFQPLHHGHVYILNLMRKSCEFLKIGIGSAQLSGEINNPFTAKEREEFIKTVLKKRNIPPENYDIYKIPDIFNAEKWVDHVTSIVGHFDILYSNSDWVRDLFKREGYQLAKKKNIFKNKYNGTHIREQIIKDDKSYRNLIPNEVIEIMKKHEGIERIKNLNSN